MSVKKIGNDIKDVATDIAEDRATFSMTGLGHHSTSHLHLKCCNRIQDVWFMPR